MMTFQKLHRLNAALASLLACLYAAWWLSSDARHTDVVEVFALIAFLPNALLVYGLWRGNRTATTFAGFLAPFYFAHGVMELVANPAVRGWVAAETLLSAALFFSAMLALRGGAPAPASDAADD